MCKHPPHPSKAQKKKKKVKDSQGPNRHFWRRDGPWCRQSLSEGGSPDAPWDPAIERGWEGERQVKVWECNNKMASRQRGEKLQIYVLR